MSKLTEGRTESGLVNYEKLTSTLSWHAGVLRTYQLDKQLYQMSHTRRKNKSSGVSGHIRHDISNSAIPQTSKYCLKLNADTGCNPGICTVVAQGSKAPGQLSLHSRVSLEVIK